MAFLQRQAQNSGSGQSPLGLELQLLQGAIGEMLLSGIFRQNTSFLVSRCGGFLASMSLRHPLGVPQGRSPLTRPPPQDGAAPAGRGLCPPARAHAGRPSEQPGPTPPTTCVVLAAGRVFP